MNTRKRSLFKVFRASFNDAICTIKNLFHRYNVVVCRDLPRSWCDRDELMFHAMFQILVDFVELEQEFVDWKKRYSVKRFTDRKAMREYIEQAYNTQEGRESMYWPDITKQEKANTDKRTLERYNTCKEILYLYEWYKDKKYDFDIFKMNKLTGTRVEFTDDGMVHKPTGDQPLITNEEYFQLYDEHEVVRNKMLYRILNIRKHLWT